MAVCSPGNIERRPGDRIKTDKRDAIRLARLFAAGDLRLVWIPSEEQEQLRDLVRAREDLRGDLSRARQRLSHFLRRRALSISGPGKSWTQAHRKWLRAYPQYRRRFERLRERHEERGTLSRRGRPSVSSPRVMPSAA